MALPILLQKLFQNGGAGDKLNTSILPSASTAAVGAAQIASSAEATAGTDTTKIMTPALTKQAIDKFAPVKTVNGNGPDSSGDIQVAGLPLGHLFAWPFQTPPDGAIQCNGATYNRTLYADFFAYASSKGWVKTEAEWQSLASANGGYCPYYSTGDGSTTFRTPKFAPFMQIAIASGNVGTYHRAGLPDISGTSTDVMNSSLYDSLHSGGTTGYGGALYWEPHYGTSRRGLIYQSVGATSSSPNYSTGFKASRSNSIYGRSTTVQPESNEWMICVVVAGRATNIGSVDVGNVMSAVAQVQAQVGAIPTPSAYITKTWRSGASWYRKWSDGFLEQGGVMPMTKGSTQRTISFNASFSSPTAYVVLVQSYQGGAADCFYNNFHVESKTASGFTGKNCCVENVGNLWYACGY